jgi:hypothetical protein
MEPLDIYQNHPSTGTVLERIVSEVDSIWKDITSLFDMSETGPTFGIDQSFLTYLKDWETLVFKIQTRRNRLLDLIPPEGFTLPEVIAAWSEKKLDRSLIFEEYILWRNEIVDYVNGEIPQIDKTLKEYINKVKKKLPRRFFK